MVECFEAIRALPRALKHQINILIRCLMFSAEQKITAMSGEVFSLYLASYIYPVANCDVKLGPSGFAAIICAIYFSHYDLTEYPFYWVAEKMTKNMLFTRSLLL